MLARPEPASRRTGCGGWAGVTHGAPGRWEDLPSPAHPGARHPGARTCGPSRLGPCAHVRPPRVRLPTHHTTGLPTSARSPADRRYARGTRGQAAPVRPRNPIRAVPRVSQITDESTPPMPGGGSAVPWIWASKERHGPTQTPGEGSPSLSRRPLPLCPGDPSARRLVGELVPGPAWAAAAPGDVLLSAP